MKTIKTVVKPLVHLRKLSLIGSVGYMSQTQVMDLFTEHGVGNGRFLSELRISHYDWVTATNVAYLNERIRPGRLVV
jgi:hypothetical protein